jgi:hypothetical protein
MAIPPVFLTPVMKWAIATIGGAALMHWVVREIRRVNEDLDRVRAAPSMDRGSRQDLPTLRRDPITGEWRVR